MQTGLCNLGKRFLARLLALAGPLAAAQSPTWLTAQGVEAAVGDAHGLSVAVSGNYGIVGAPRDSDGIYGGRAVHFYERGEGDASVQRHKVARECQPGHHGACCGLGFGARVAISGTRAVVEWVFNPGSQITEPTASPIPAGALQ
jgi:hypothetical protein